jgi:hypothetical protein
MHDDPRTLKTDFAVAWIGGEGGGGHSQLYLVDCPFCCGELGSFESTRKYPYLWWSAYGLDLTSRNSLTPPQPLDPTKIECPRCGTIVASCEVSENSEIVVRLASGLGPQFVQLLTSLVDVSVELVKAVTWSVLGGLTKDEIKERFLIKKGDIRQFERTLNKVLDAYEMMICKFCNRPVNRRDAFCDRCGKALY